uniref:Uncharacterized protein n=1 Tax=Populus alba TaxID=43335 RepID=A0A4U5QCV1_POPAL|nr:hypothetical protein D5086_0000106920 [Populus alba]
MGEALKKEIRAETAIEVAIYQVAEAGTLELQLVHGAVQGLERSTVLLMKKLLTSQCRADSTRCHCWKCSWSLTAALRRRNGWNSGAVAGEEEKLTVTGLLAG